MAKSLKKSHIKRVSDKEYKRLLSKKRRTKKENKTLKKVLNQRYCSCLKAIESNPKLNRNAAFGICARSIFINRGLSVPPEISKSCNPPKTRTRTKKRG